MTKPRTTTKQNLSDTSTARQAVHKTLKATFTALLAVFLAATLPFALCKSTALANQASDGSAANTIASNELSNEASNEGNGSEASSQAPDKILKGETEIEQLTNSYKDAQEKLSEALAKIEWLEQEIPPQQEKSDKAIRACYKNRSDALAILNVLFEAESLDDFLKQSDYIVRISKANLAEVNRLKEMKAELDEAKKVIEVDAESAKNALFAKQNERASRQAQGIKRAQDQAAQLGGEASVGVAADGGEQPEDYREAATQETGALNDGADWYADRDAFIAYWAGRLNNYLEGSALQGQGENFAKAAWKYNIDPRWSAAISNTESSKGEFCIRPHNAWGWGANDSDPYGMAFEWDCWEDAIDAHAKGLSEGYGYTISINGAKTYAPNTWQSWYNKTLTQMSLI